MNKPATIGLAVVATAGVAFAAFSFSDNSAQDAADYAATRSVVTPTVTKTVTAPPEPATTVTVAPDACVQALTDADAALALSGEGFDILGDALEAAGNYDVEGVSTATQNMSLFNKRLTVALTKYREARDTCKAAQ